MRVGFVVLIGVFGFVAVPAGAQTFPASECGDRLVSSSPKILAQGPVIFDAPADVDGDGTIDEIMGDGTTVTVTYRGASAKPPQVVADSAGQGVTVLAVHELDGLKGAELVVQRRTGIEVLGADASGSLVTLATLKKGPPTIGRNVVLPGYFRGAQQPEFLLGDDFSLSFTLYALSGGELTPVSGIDPLILFAGTDLPFGMAVADMDGDGLDDIVLGTPKGANLLRLGNRTSWDVFQTLEAPIDSTASFAVAVGDFDGDGRRDVLSALDPFGDVGAVDTWLQKAPGTFTLLPELSKTGAWSSNDPFLTGDLDGDGKDDFVTLGMTGHLVNDTWQYSIFSTGAPLGLFDWDGDGALEYTSTDTQSQLGRERAALSDLELTLDPSQSQLDVSGAIYAQLIVTNHGPTATEGFAFTTTLPDATIDGCVDTKGSMSAAVLEPGASCFTQLRQSDTTQPMPGTFDVTVCSGAPDMNAANNRVELPITKTDQADVLVGMSAAFATTGAFSATAYVANDGRAEAHDVSIRMTVAPPPATPPTVDTSEASAKCTTDSSGATCTLSALKFGGNWVVSLSGLRYTGTEIVITSTVTTGSPDPDSTNNQYVMDIPAGLKPPGGGSLTDTPGATGGTLGTKADSGCACGVRRRARGGAALWFVAAIAGIWRRRGRDRRRSARSAC